MHGGVAVIHGLDIVNINRNKQFLFSSCLPSLPVPSPKQCTSDTKAPVISGQTVHNLLGALLCCSARSSLNKSRPYYKTPLGRWVLHETCPHILVVSKSISVTLTFYCNFNINAWTLSAVTASASCSQKQQTACSPMTKEISVLQISVCFKTLPRCHSMFPVTEIFCPVECIWCYKYKVHGQIIILTFLFNKERISHALDKERDCTAVAKPGLSLLPPTYSSLRRSLPWYSMLLPREGLSLEWVCWLSHALARACNDLHGVRKAPMGFSGSTAVTSRRGTRANTCHQLPKWLQLFPKLMPPGFR